MKINEDESKLSVIEVRVWLVHSHYACSLAFLQWALRICSPIKIGKIIKKKGVC